jgi:hypothetical protein
MVQILGAGQGQFSKNLPFLFKLFSLMTQSLAMSLDTLACKDYILVD